MKIRALAVLATLSLSALAGCTAAGGAPTDVAALHGNSAVMSDAAVDQSTYASVEHSTDTDVIGPNYDPSSHRFIGGWWKDH